MRRFAFDIKAKEFSTEENGWTFRMKCPQKMGFFYLKSPVMEEITYSKGKTIRYNVHTVLGVGYVDDGFIFRGVALFDFTERVLVALAMFIGGCYDSGNLYGGLTWASIFYSVITFITWNDDTSYLHKAQMMCQS